MRIQWPQSVAWLYGKDYTTRTVGLKKCTGRPVYCNVHNPYHVQQVKKFDEGS